MRGHYLGRRSTAARIDREEHIRGGARAISGNETLYQPAAFSTARELDTARDMHTARDMETARDMHTARDFDAESSLKDSIGANYQVQLYLLVYRRCAHPSDRLVRRAANTPISWICE